ncbi:MAG: M48 family metallopeptidase [Chloroflexi bacterium]|nr:MAG: M48 family metallopeptidase [Chloroflexota bacterium]
MTRIRSARRSGSWRPAGAAAPSPPGSGRACCLAERAKRLNDRYFAGRLSWTSIGYTDTLSLWGSCTFTIGAIRVASRMKAFPDWVVDYVLMHELTHLVHSNHGPAFHEMLDRYPMAERAKGYLIAAQQLSQMPGGA